MREVILPPPPPFRVAVWAVVYALYHRVLSVLHAQRQAVAEHVGAVAAAARARLSAAVHAADAPEHALSAVPAGNAPRSTVPVRLGRGAWSAQRPRAGASSSRDERATAVEVR
jgi:hypothetical protein